MKIELVAGRSRLSIRIVNDLGWSEVRLQDGGADRRLGASGNQYLAQHLLGMLSGEGLKGTTGEFEGMRANWVLSLSEDHHVLYATTAGESLILFWQDTRSSPTSVVGRVELSPEERRTWIAQLQALQEWRPSKARSSPVQALGLTVVALMALLILGSQARDCANCFKPPPSFPTGK